MSNRTEEDLIREIKAVQDELGRLEVKPEYVNFRRLSREELAMERRLQRAVETTEKTIFRSE